MPVIAEVLELLKRLCLEARCMLGDAETWYSKAASPRNKAAISVADEFSAMILGLQAAYAAGEVGETGVTQQLGSWMSSKAEEAVKLRQRLKWDFFNQYRLSYKLFILDKSVDRTRSCLQQMQVAMCSAADASSCKDQQQGDQATPKFYAAHA